jgi:hypothetical protein
MKQLTSKRNTYLSTEREQSWENEGGQVRSWQEEDRGDPKRNSLKPSHPIRSLKFKKHLTKKTHIAIRFYRLGSQVSKMKTPA